MIATVGAVAVSRIRMQTSGSQNFLSLYFHIPFCSRKCDYCHFYVLPDLEQDKELLLQGFFLEWENWFSSIQSGSLASVYFGGGTPSLFGPARIKSLLDRLTLHFGPIPEITLEVNPEGVTPALMAAYKQAGINRMSVGIQTLDDTLLKRLGRTHQAQQACAAVEAICKSGVENVSIDLMYDVPGQSLESWKATLDRAIRLPITHLSLYNLTIEPETVFFKKRNLLQPLLPDAETSLAMYLAAVDRFAKVGLEQYEISAFAKSGCQSVHNKGYWTGRPFLGWGPSAFSYWQGSRFRNISHLKKYLEALQKGHSPVDFSEQLEPAAKQRELLAIQLRLIEGVNQEEFSAQHGPFEKELSQVLENLVKKGFLVQDDPQLKLTQQGRLFYDTVAAEII